MSWEVDSELALRLLLSFGIGSAIGIEREFRSKAAGLRTMIMICLGATIFTEISMRMSPDTPDRIASNIITGIGFLGAGVIFKDGLTISGITTATTIWICAALGMAVGSGEYFIATVGSVVVLIVLTLFEKVKMSIIRFHQARTYRIVVSNDHEFDRWIRAEAAALNLGIRQERDMKQPEGIVLLYEIYGKEDALNKLNVSLKKNAGIQSYEYSLN
jgi:putative Mg2+ transporter-C (MgtC) family protein